MRTSDLAERRSRRSCAEDAEEQPKIFGFFCALCETFASSAFRFSGVGLLAGCSLIPTYERPAAPVPTVFPGDPAQPAGQRGVGRCRGAATSPTRGCRS